MNNNRPIIIPWDFSDLAEFALQHAEKMAKIVKCDILLLHIVKKKSEIEKATEKLESTVLEQGKKYGIRPKFVVREGSIFTDINKIIDEENAFFAIMGTHGIKGMQKFTGSWALKVIIGSSAPFIVVQDSPQSDNLNKIVFPVDFKFSEKEKLVWAEFIHRFFKSKFYLCYIDSNDQIFKKKIIANMMIAKKFLTEKGVDYDIVKLEGKNLSDEALLYADEIKADLIMITTTKNISFHDYMLGASEQKLIANEKKIPVMTINPRKDLTKLTGFN
ncbi:MAG: universal stress protein [Bacteroidales bacterium]|nr:universal stress protein [Bacteroidales bacterium]